jgi:hypothetical protein
MESSPFLFVAETSFGALSDCGNLPLTGSVAWRYRGRITIGSRVGHSATPLRSSRTVGSPVRVHIEVQKFSNLKISFIFSDKEEGPIPALAPSCIPLSAFEFFGSLEKPAFWRVFSF